MRVDYFSVISTTTLFEFMIVTKIWKKNNRRIAVRVRNIKKKHLQGVLGVSFGFKRGVVVLDRVGLAECVFNAGAVDARLLVH